MPCLLAMQNLLECHGVAFSSRDLQKLHAEFAMTLPEPAGSQTGWLGPRQCYHFASVSWCHSLNLGQVWGLHCLGTVALQSFQKTLEHRN